MKRLPAIVCCLLLLMGCADMDMSAPASKAQSTKVVDESYSMRQTSALVLDETVGKQTRTAEAAGEERRGALLDAMAGFEPGGKAAATAIGRQFTEPDERLHLVNVAPRRLGDGLCTGDIGIGAIAEQSGFALQPHEHSVGDCHARIRALGDQLTSQIKKGFRHGQRAIAVRQWFVEQSRRLPFKAPIDRAGRHPGGCQPPGGVTPGFDRADPWQARAVGHSNSSCFGLGAIRARRSARSISATGRQSGVTMNGLACLRRAPMRRRSS